MIFRRLRNWVIRFNEQGADGLINICVRGRKQLMRMGWFEPFARGALLVARKQLLSKLMDLEGKHAGHLAGIWIEDGCRHSQVI